MGYFNPRSRKGSDERAVRFDAIGKISIHAPAKGATVREGDDFEESIISIHAPAKGATNPNMFLHLIL